MNENLEEIFRVLEMQKNSKIVRALFEKEELDIHSLMDFVNYPHRYKSKFMSRYISKLQKIGYIGNNNGFYFLTPYGVLFFKTLGDLTSLKMSNKVRLIKLIRKPKTIEQLYTTLKISRIQCHQLLKCLKKRGIVESETRKYRICPNVRLNELKGVPLYYWKLLNILLTKESCSAQEISTATGLALKGVQTRLSELKRMSIVESTGPNPLPQRSFFKFYKLTDMGKGVLKKITEFEKLIN
ncbi:MAG: winged helix-turn-helix transcriptional regulator, partial [Promethearchaeota archaeon]